MIKYLDIIVCATFLIFFVHGALGSSCGTCDKDSCDPPLGCLAGRVTDACNCCYVCGRKEGERCDSEELNFIGYGKCGDNLQCRVRNDLDRYDPPEAVCFCQSQSPLCGSDGVTYDNICLLTEERYRRRDGLRAVSNDPCMKAPKIMTPPQNVRNTTGTSEAMRCEAKAWPAPTIGWLVVRNNTLHKLPGDSTRVAVQSRGGPDVDETTSWLLFLEIGTEDEGTYVCKAENDLGSDKANATVSIVA